MRVVQIQGEGDIVLVDDDPDFHMLFEYIFKRQKNLRNKLIKLSSGEACLKFLDNVIAEELDFPSLILMDINMPGYTGIETVELIRRKPHFSTLPIVSMLSSSNFQGDIDKSLAAGANDYIEKPFNLRELVLENKD